MIGRVGAIAYKVPRRSRLGEEGSGGVQLGPCLVRGASGNLCRGKGAGGSVIRSLGARLEQEAHRCCSGLLQGTCGDRKVAESGSF